MERWQIIEGDALAALREMPDASVDGIVTDPPYSSGGQYRGDRTGRTGSKYLQTGDENRLPDFAGDNRDARGWQYWCALWLSECLRIAKPGSPLVVFCDWRQLPAATDAVQAGGWVWRGIGGWDKTEAARPMLASFRQQLEFYVWGTAGARGNQEGVPCLAGCQRAYLPGDQKEHQTAKPIPVMRELVQIVRPQGIVLDPFCGSGSTGVAALHEGRRFIGIERVAEYATISRRRLAAADADTGGEVLRPAGTQPSLFGVA